MHVLVYTCRPCSSVRVYRNVLPSPPAAVPGDEGVVREGEGREGRVCAVRPGSQNTSYSLFSAMTCMVVCVLVDAFFFSCNCFVVKSLKCGGESRRDE